MMSWEGKETESAASYNKRVSNVPHTIFCCRPPKSTLPSQGREKHISFGRQKENKRIVLRFLTKQFFLPFFFFPNAAAFLIVLVSRRKETTSK
jgi:hypothetical protein